MPSHRSEEHTSELQSHDNLGGRRIIDRKSTRLNSSHTIISYAVFCLKKKAYRRARRAVGDERAALAAAVQRSGRPAAVHRSGGLARGGRQPGYEPRYLFFLMRGRPPRLPPFPQPPLSR